MIRLINLLKEADDPESSEERIKKLYDDEKEFFRKGFKLSPPEINPETGTSTSTATYLPKFKQIRKDLYQMEKDIEAFKYSRDEDIELLAVEGVKALRRISKIILALDKRIELKGKGHD